jgi:ribonuclease HII
LSRGLGAANVRSPEGLEPQWTALGLDGEWALLDQLTPELLNDDTAGDDPSTLNPRRRLTIIGLDEAGRGCVAGPVVAGAVACELRWQPHTAARTPPTVASAASSWHGIRDSKRLSAQRREHMAKHLGLDKEPLLEWKNTSADDGANLERDPVLIRPKLHHHAGGPAPEHLLEQARGKLGQHVVLCSLQARYGMASCDEIEKFNIWEATQWAIARALAALPKIDGPCVLFFDGKLACKLPAAYALNPLITVIKGDDHLRTVGAASIVAKVTRDRLMTQLETTYPGFGFAKHKGYGTASHFAALSKIGPSPEHRLSFLTRLHGS